MQLSRPALLPLNTPVSQRNNCWPKTDAIFNIPICILKPFKDHVTDKVQNDCLESLRLHKKKKKIRILRGKLAFCLKILVYEITPMIFFRFFSPLCVTYAAIWHSNFISTSPLTLKAKRSAELSSCHLLKKTNPDLSFGCQLDHRFPEVKFAVCVSHISVSSHLLPACLDPQGG